MALHSAVAIQGDDENLLAKQRMPDRQDLFCLCLEVQGSAP